MTLRYAKLLDETKRKAFESVINQGVFSFDLNGEVQKLMLVKIFLRIYYKHSGKSIN